MTDARIRARTTPKTSPEESSPWPVVIQGAAAMAVGLGVGRFVYTPILPLMEHQAGLPAALASDLATANYLGYFIGALLGILVPSLARSRSALRASMAVIVVTLALMPVTRNTGAWLALRLIAGAASALLFVIASSAMLARLHRQAQHLVGWGFGGVGLGIALSGALVLVVQEAAGDSSWQAAWWSAAILAVVLSAVAWTLRTEPPGAPTALQRHEDQEQGDARESLPRTHRWFAALLVSYSLEGVGYIIAGTFLVAAISQNSSGGQQGWLGSGAWVVVGLAGIPAAAMWAYLAHRRARSTLLLIALLIQSVGIALPSLAGGIAPALISAVLFDNTFIAISALAISIGAHLQFPRSVALLTAGYSIGQILGPLVVKPLIHGGYHDALLVGAAIVLAAAIAAVALRARFPHRVGAMVEPAHAGAARAEASYAGAARAGAARAAGKP